MKDIVKQFKESISKLTTEEFKKVWDEIEAEIGTDYPIFNAKTKCFEYKINNTETIEQAAEDYANSFEYNDYTIETEAAFKAGVEFAEEWYSVNEKLPENVESLLVATNKKRLKRQIVGFVKTKQVLVKFRDGTFDLGRRCKCHTDDYYFWDCLESFEKNNPRNIIEWRPIELN